MVTRISLRYSWIWTARFPRCTKENHWEEWSILDIVQLILLSYTLIINFSRFFLYLTCNLFTVINCCTKKSNPLLQEIPNALKKKLLHWSYGKDYYETHGNLFCSLENWRYLFWEDANAGILFLFGIRISFFFFFYVYVCVYICICVCVYIYLNCRNMHYIGNMPYDAILYIVVFSSWV